MGLDAVEIVLRTEEFFGVAIADDEAGAVRTVGDLYRLMCSKLEVGGAGKSINLRNASQGHSEGEAFPVF